MIAKELITELKKCIRLDILAAKSDKVKFSDKHWDKLHDKIMSDPIQIRFTDKEVLKDILREALS